MTNSSKIGTKQRRINRLIQEYDHDPYKMKRKPPEEATCPRCGAVFTHGRWQWPLFYTHDSYHELCQACRRIEDHYPAGLITIRGGFASQHKAELLNLIQNTETLEKELHPLHRLMEVKERPDGLDINTTDIHLPRRIGEALHRAFKGHLNIHYEKGAYFARVNWRRDN